VLDWIVDGEPPSETVTFYGGAVLECSGFRQLILVEALRSAFANGFPDAPRLHPRARYARSPTATLAFCRTSMLCYIHILSPFSIS